ncbi:MAG: alpha/beta fold hydrolase, partial [Halioglobus sp.]|nr:alpha/beta fold hydrolase [Halioglobus sp.]
EIYPSQDSLNEQKMLELFEFGLVYDPRHITDELIAQRMQVMALMNTQVMVSMDIPPLAERLGELRCPVLVFWGTNDAMMPDSGILALAKHCHHMKMLLLSECGHWAMVEHQALFNRECLQFLRHDVAGL